MLDLGCGTGANLIPLAFYDPAGSFVGIDASPLQIERAEQMSAELGLENIRFRCSEFADLGERVVGPFDYVLVHAVFSWISPAARKELLGICQSQLGKDGLLFLSYNVFPGWKLRGAVREILLRSVGQIVEPSEQARQAQRLAEKLLSALPADSLTPYQQLLAHELGRVVEGHLYYVLHEYLAPHNSAFYFRDIVSQTNERGFKYLADAQFNQPAGQLPEDLCRHFESRGFDAIETEQTIDFLLNRQFRSSIFCRTDGARPSPPSVENLDDLWVASYVTPLTKRMDYSHEVTECFRYPDGREIEVADPPIKAALTVLAGRSPRGRSATELIATAESLLVGEWDEVELPGREGWFERFLGLHVRGMAELRLREPELVDAPDLVPHELARSEARLRPHLTTPFHLPYYLDDGGRELLRQDSKALLGSEKLRGRFASTLAELNRWGLLEKHKG